MTDENEKTCRDAFDVWGTDAQLMIAMEELAELTVAISHFVRERPTAHHELAYELADVELVCASLRTIVADHGVWDVDKIKQAKWQRLRDRIEESNSKIC